MFSKNSFQFLNLSLILINYFLRENEFLFYLRLSNLTLRQDILNMILESTIKLIPMPYQRLSKSSNSYGILSLK